MNNGSFHRISRTCIDECFLKNISILLLRLETYCISNGLFSNVSSICKCFLCKLNQSAEYCQDCDAYCLDVTPHVSTLTTQIYALISLTQIPNTCNTLNETTCSYFPDQMYAITPNNSEFLYLKVWSICTYMSYTFRH